MTRRNDAQIVHLPKGAVRPAKRAAPKLEKALLTHPEWLRLAAQGSQLGLWYWNEITQSLFWDRKTREIFGVNLDGDVTLDTFYKALHSDDLARVRQVWRYQLESGLPCELEYRAQRPDGSIRWINARGNGYYTKAGKPEYMIAVVSDVTERKEAEQARLGLSGRLINAQEQERRRLAQEIHDDFGQRLSLVMVELEAVAELTKETKAGQRVAELVRTLDELTSDLHCLSHRLYSSKLDTLGLVPSVRSLCLEFVKQHGIEIRFDHEDVPEHLLGDIALSLFRIAQEGLSNATKHSGAGKVHVQLKGSADAISLTVFDNGTGFDLMQNSSAEGIGVQSMRERVRSLGGIFEIRSRPSVEGTQISASVPLKNVRRAAA